MENFQILQTCSLFAGLTPPQIEKACGCFCKEQKTYAKNEIIMLEDDNPVPAGIVVSGQIEATRSYSDGKLDVVAHIGAGGMFGEILAAAGSEKSPVTLTAIETARVVFVDYKKLITPCGNLCDFHAKIIANLLRIIAVQYWDLNRKLRYLSAPSLREKILAFLSDFPQGEGGEITIPFDREKMASYLNADRSALSRELSRMKADRLIAYQKNKFRLLF